ncbi:transposase [Salinisphaera orenii]|uniref:Transposase n=1 Tax=Salinisphaera orenii YIM 95161 TaxID=1051139 RepID=A0A423Q1L7_9GAMM|nr:transposase [Salinisphaera halophila]ROO32365.1 transposase [Salinisphaera halophila YIM 95161]
MPQHIIQRDNNRQACFFDEEDYLFYLECLRDAAARAGCEIHAYVLMTNHVHLLATPQQADAASRIKRRKGSETFLLA